jgi:hypothetical protein
MQDMEKLQAKGEVTEEELRALEQDMTGKVRVACHVSSWIPVILFAKSVYSRTADLTRILAGNPLRSCPSVTRGELFACLVGHSTNHLRIRLWIKS